MYKDIHLSTIQTKAYDAGNVKAQKLPNFVNKASSKLIKKVNVSNIFFLSISIGVKAY